MPAWGYVLLDLQRARSDQVAHARFHAVETSEDHDRTLHPGRDPSFSSLESVQNRVEAGGQVFDHVVVVE